MIRRRSRRAFRDAGSTPERSSDGFSLRRCATCAGSSGTRSVRCTPGMAARASDSARAPGPRGSWSTPVFASRPVAALFRARVASITPASIDDAMVVVELAHRETGPRLAIVVIERATSDAAVERLAESFEAEAAQTVWLSHPSDWTRALERLAWVARGARLAGTASHRPRWRRRVPGRPVRAGVGRAGPTRE